jgi:hypothetical protein
MKAALRDRFGMRPTVLKINHRTEAFGGTTHLVKMAGRDNAEKMT